MNPMFGSITRRIFNLYVVFSFWYPVNIHAMWSLWCGCYLFVTWYFLLVLTGYCYNWREEERIIWQKLVLKAIETCFLFYHCDQHCSLYKHPNLLELRGSHDYYYSNQSSTSIIRPKNIYSTYGTQIPLPANRRAFVSGRSQDVDMERYLISNHICILHVMSRVPLGLYRDYQYLMSRTVIIWFSLHYSTS